MKTKSFQTYLGKRLSKKEIAQIKEQAEIEVRIYLDTEIMITHNSKL